MGSGSWELWGIEEGIALEQCQIQDYLEAPTFGKGISPLICIWLEKSRNSLTSNQKVDEDRMVVWEPKFNFRPSI